MKALIIDNEQEIRTGLKQLIYRYCPQIKEIAEADGVKSGALAIIREFPDLVFLDVELDDGNGIDLIKEIGSFKFQLVFITAHNEYAIHAFKLSAVDFLLKPIDPADLKVAVEKVEKAIKTVDYESQIKVLSESIKTQTHSNPKIVLKASEAIHFVKIDDIIRCEAEGSYTTFIIHPDVRIVMSKGLKEYEEILQKHEFIRTHHSHLVNLKRVIRFDKSDGGFLILDNGDAVPVSQRKKDIILSALKTS